MADITATFANLSSTESSNQPSGTTTLGAGLDDNLRIQSAHIAAWRDLTGWGGILLSSVAGTNTITATIATAGSVTFGPTALAAGQRFILIPANTNTGATNLNITSPNGGSSLTAKNVFWAGAACSGGELIQNCPVELEYDGTQFNILGVTVGSRLTNSIGADVNLNNTANFFDGPTVSQGTVGTWFVTGAVTLIDTAGLAEFYVKLWDGTTVIASAISDSATGSAKTAVSLSGYISSPSGNLRISAKDVSATTGKMLANASGGGKDSTITAVRIG